MHVRKHIHKLAAAATAVLALATLPAHAAAMTIVSPANGARLEWSNLRPIVAFDVADGETPKWILLASDAEMKSTIRYCRQFGTVNVNGGFHWGCNNWAVGVDAYGRDVARPLESNRTYWFQMVYTDAAKAEQKTAIQSFTINQMDGADTDPSQTAQNIWDEQVGDGSKLNLGAAAFVNSGVKKPDVKSERVKRNRFRIVARFNGGVDVSRSYVRIKSRAGVRHVRLTPWGPGRARAVWVRSAAERNLRNQQYSYQVFVKATKNGAMVRSEKRVILIRTNRKTRRSSIPAWTPV